ncbi:MAG: sulfite oxidase heme-binding subunit YedZ [Anaerolineales bacterium]
MHKLKARWLQTVTHVAALLPLAWLLWDYGQGSFLVDTVKEITTRTGRTALILLMLSLACTPIHTVFGFKQVLPLRRPLGLYAFLYTGLHFLTFVDLDYGFDFDLIWLDILDQRYVLVGFAAGLLLLSLAITSTRGWQKRLGKSWKRLHWLVYLASVLTIVHFAWQVKDIREPLRYAAVLTLLLILRIPSVTRAASGARHQLKTTRQSQSEA